MNPMVLALLASIGNVFYVLGGYFLGKWESDKSDLRVLEQIEEVRHTVSRSTGRLMEELEPSEPEPDADEGIGYIRPSISEEEAAEEYYTERKLAILKEMLEKSAPHSLRLGVVCLVAGSILFGLSLILID